MTHVKCALPKAQTALKQEGDTFFKKDKHATSGLKTGFKTLYYNSAGVALLPKLRDVKIASAFVTMQSVQNLIDEVKRNRPSLALTWYDAGAEDHDCSFDSDEWLLILHT